ncbi:MAG: hypothetical protein LBH07_07240, partial [Treponema sp.]|nr:hypothetical protein [Treponema sp.]
MIPANSSILVISDSHGNVPALAAVLSWAGSQIHLTGDQVFGAAIFLGDGANDLDTASAYGGFTVPWYKVRGNGDFNLSSPDTQILEIAGTGSTSRKIFLSHGNRYGVERDLKVIADASRNAGAEAAFEAGEHVIGSAMECDVALTDSTLAKRHCSFSLAEDGTVLLTPLEGTLTLNG